MDVERDRFYRDEALPLAWYNHSTDLRGAAAALECATEEPCWTEIVKRFDMGGGEGVRNVQLMLFGLSLELLYKAIVVAKTRTAPRQTHDLVKLAEEAGMQVDVTESGPLRLLSHAIYWGGRYPVPRELKFKKEYSNLFSDVMFEPRPAQSGLRGRRPACVLDWSHFERLWWAGSAIYEKHTRRDG